MVAVASLVGVAPTASAQVDQPAPVVGSGDDSRSVERLYRAYFLRPPDPSGLAHWEQRWAQGTPLVAISEAFAGSPEFLARYGDLDDAGFVTLLYRNVLEREPDAGGLRQWTGRLAAGASRGLVMLGFSDSEEFKRQSTIIGTGDDSRSVERLYLAYFLRAPDTAGLAYWTHEWSRGIPLPVISDAFAASAEFRNRYGALSNDDFVRLVYRNVLDRDPDDAGLRHWTTALFLGASRGQVMLGFSDSEEFKRTGRATAPAPPPEPPAGPVHAPDPAKPSAPAGTYAFAQAHDGLPVQWSPCAPVAVVANFAGAPAGAEVVLRDVLAQLSAATRIPWVFEGPTGERSTGAGYDRALRDVDRYGDRFSPVLVSWPEAPSAPGEGGTLNRVRFGLAGERPWYVSGWIDLDSARPASELRLSLLYSFAAMAGLDDVATPAQVMGTDGFAASFSTYQPGDLAGLARVGAWDWDCPT